MPTKTEIDSTIRRLAGRIYKQPQKRYLSYIFSPQWAQRRREHLQAVDYWCEICKAAKACQVHHWTYVRLGHEHPMDLSAVCVTCHHKLHLMVPNTPANDNEQLELPLIEAG